MLLENLYQTEDWAQLKRRTVNPDNIHFLSGVHSFWGAWNYRDEPVQPHLLTVSLFFIPHPFFGSRKGDRQVDDKPKGQADPGAGARLWQDTVLPDGLRRIVHVKCRSRLQRIVIPDGGIVNPSQHHVTHGAEGDDDHAGTRAHFHPLVRMEADGMTTVRVVVGHAVVRKESEAAFDRLGQRSEKVRPRIAGPGLFTEVVGLAPSNALPGAVSGSPADRGLQVAEQGAVFQDKTRNMGDAGRWCEPVRITREELELRRAVVRSDKEVPVHR